MGSARATGRGWGPLALLGPLLHIDGQHGDWLGVFKVLSQEHQQMGPPGEQPAMVTGLWVLCVLLGTGALGL